jgi:hypothetical protein
MCDKNVFRLTTTSPGEVSAGEGHGSPVPEREHDPFGKDILQLHSSGYFIITGLPRNPKHPDVRKVSGDPTKSSPENLIPMHHDDHHALLAWVRAKREWELACRI